MATSMTHSPSLNHTLIQNDNLVISVDTDVRSFADYTTVQKSDFRFNNYNKFFLFTSKKTQNFK